ncbi:MAG TPA: FTR1 family protein [Allocoleopsis sp.]
MDFSAALPTFVITLREGVEATLVVGIVLACLKKAKQNNLKIWVYIGIGVGIALSAIIGVILSEITQSLSNSNQPFAPVFEPLLEAVFSLIAIFMLSWMLIWMTKQSKLMKSQIEGSVNSALRKNASLSIFSLILIAILREGFETVLFIVAKFQQGLIPALGSFMGLITAIAIGVLLFKLGVRINLAQFFKFMGILLLLIVAGLVISCLAQVDTAINTLAQMNRQSEGLCFYYERFTKIHSCILGGMVWNTSKILPDDKFPGLILSALFGYQDKLYVVQAISYVGFLVSLGTIYFRSLGGKVTGNNKQISVDTPSKLD